MVAEFWANRATHCRLCSTCDRTCRRPPCEASDLDGSCRTDPGQGRPFSFPDSWESRILEYPWRTMRQTSSIAENRARERCVIYSGRFSGRLHGKWDKSPKMATCWCCERSILNICFAEISLLSQNGAIWRPYAHHWDSRQILPVFQNNLYSAIQLPRHKTSSERKIFWSCKWDNN